MDVNRFIKYVYIRNGHSDVVSLLLQHGADVTYIKGLRNALHVAAEKGHSDVVSLLLQHGADVTPTNSRGWNALHIAARYNERTTTIVQLLLNNMKLEDINRKETEHSYNNNGRTPLDFCYYHNDSSIKQQLIDLIRQKGGKRQSEL